MRTRALTARSTAALSLMLAAVFCTSCHGWFSFYIRNETDELHYVRVTVNRTGGVFVHQVDPRTSGYAGYGGPSDPWDEGDAYIVDLLDEACNPIAAWGMPPSGGYLEISEAPEFIRGPYFPDAPSPNGTAIGASPSSDRFQHVTVLACGATDTLP